MGCSTTAATLDTLDDLLTSGIVDGTSNFALTSTVLDTLDGLDSLDDFSDSTPNAAAENESQTEVDAGEKTLDDLLDELDPGGQVGDVHKPGVKAVDQLNSLDALDLFPSVEGGVAAVPAVSMTHLDSLSDFSSNGIHDY